MSLGCRAGHARQPNPAVDVVFRADSAQFVVTFVKPFYHTAIGYVYTNRTNAPVSANYCKAPVPPTLEKETAPGHWIIAFSAIVLLCREDPPFRIAAGATYRGTLRVEAAQPGANMMPVFQVDSIPGVYRLRWQLHAGPDPNDRRAPMIDAISPSFRLIDPSPRSR